MQRLIASFNKLLRRARGKYLKIKGLNCNTSDSPLKRPVSTPTQHPESRYRLVSHPKDRDAGFARIEERIFRIHQKLSKQPNSRPKTSFVEKGRLESKHRYIYLKPQGDFGWLVEESNTGLVVSRSEKIVGKDTFLRRGDPWDIANLYCSDSLPIPRISSQQTGKKIISIAMYGHLLERAIADASEKPSPAE